LAGGTREHALANEPILANVLVTARVSALQFRNGAVDPLLGALNFLIDLNGTLHGGRGLRFLDRAMEEPMQQANHGDAPRSAVDRS
jgi:hypothetical protein